ncbi:putative nucleic acid-binding protein, contains PIN domain [Mycobacterium sp. JS623]|uniref:type II toxin-antitoxin system VapC family toxin n=1 Tax=Mycobacterium sp. JS623 TaxID=212767 RepID=UPI0002A559D3|nr:type II toxin-antitoxin system VapC family toxin [Mycobacterium sp. JS623]AGB23265.1 putative nucleic acid-binding protein, contains PIN domain [Mycobacterium sp. JS623]
MTIYVDSSALVKIVVYEAESPALARYLASVPDDKRLTAAIARTELLRAVARRGVAVENARKVLARLNFVALTASVLDVAATIGPPELRTLDAIHLAAAQVAPELRALVTYDNRLADAARAAGLAVVSPA